MSTIPPSWRLPLFVMWFFVPACSNLPIQEAHISVPPVHVKILTHEPYVVKVDPGPETPTRCWTAIFRNSAGEILGKHTGQGVDVAQGPSGTTRADIHIHPCDEPAILGAPPPFPPLQGEKHITNTPPLQIIRLPESGLGAGLIQKLLWAEVTAMEENVATEWIDNLASGWPGSDVPENVNIIALLEVHHQSSMTTLTSMLPTRFSIFQITADGDLFADLQSGWNISVTPLGSGWMAVSAVIPTSMIAPGSQLQLRQAPFGSLAPPLELTLLF